MSDPEEHQEKVEVQEERGTEQQEVEKLAQEVKEEAEDTAMIQAELAAKEKDEKKGTSVANSAEATMVKDQSSGTMKALPEMHLLQLDSMKKEPNDSASPSTTNPTVTPATADELAQWTEDITPLPSGNGDTTTRGTSVPGAFNVSHCANNSNFNRRARQPPEGAPDVEEGVTSGETAAATEEAAPEIAFTAHLAPEEQNQEGIPTDDDLEMPSPPAESGLAGPLVAAHAVPEKENPLSTTTKCSPKIMVAVVVTLALIVLFLVLGITGVFGKDKSDTTSRNGAPGSLLEEIQERGHLDCAFLDVPFMMYKDDEGNIGGVNSVWCKAIAAAIWGDADNIMEAEDAEAVVLTRIKYHDYIQYEDEDFVERDVHATSFTHTMHRETVKSIWRGFSSPFYYDGARVGGEADYVECAEGKGFKYLDECSGLRVCVMDESTSQVFLETVMPKQYIFPYRSPVDAINAFVNGTCNTFLMESLGVAEPTVRYFGYEGDTYAKGVSMYSKEPITVVTPQSDTQFADFVDAIVHATLAAEQHGITRATADIFPETFVFGETYKNMFRNVIRVVGNYADIYGEHLEGDFPREAVNQLNNGTTGLMYAHPFGDLGPTPEDEYVTFGPTLERILNRGKLLCGVRGDRPGFAILSNSSNSGLDIDFCRAVAASLFEGDIEALDLVEISSQQRGFGLLATGDIDLVAGATWNLVNEVKETSTGLGFDFSQPYFFGDIKGEDNLCLATMEDDHDWATIIYWVVAATIYAEEHGYNTTSANSMPEVLVYGSNHNRIFRDTILMVGNYGDMYRRNVEEFIPRAGRNLLNGGKIPGPQHYPMPGLI